MKLSAQDFRAQKTSSRSNAQGWLKHIGKLGFPVHLLLIFYQIVVVAYDLMIMSILTYKELWLSVIYLIFPLSKKNLNSEVAVVSEPFDMNHRRLCLTDLFFVDCWIIAWPRA